MLLIFMVNGLGCRKATQAEDVIHFIDSSSMSEFLSEVHSVNFIPIKSADNHLLGSRVELVLANDGTFVLCDMVNTIIYRYDSSGEFLNSIGRRGNGPGEYLNITNVQAIKGGIAVITQFEGIKYFDLDGHFLYQEDNGDLGLQSLIVDEGILTYNGYLPTAKYRSTLLKDGRIEKEYLPTKKPAIPYSTTIPQLTEYDGKLFLIDSYSNILYKYESGQLDPYLEFDFGEYAVPESYYKAEDVYEGAELLLSSEFAFIQRYLESDHFALAEILIQKHSGLKVVYGLFKDSQWRWFSEGPSRKAAFNETPRVARGKTLYSLIPSETAAAAVKLFSHQEKKMAANYNEEEYSYVIAEINLR